MTEEHVTKAILKWLLDNQWKIICFDFPQSGTGRFLHPNGTSEKNKGAINPDIVAIRGGICLFFENKDRYYFPDFEKINSLIVANDYTDDITKLLEGNIIETVFYGIGLPSVKHKQGSKDAAHLVDFIVGVDEDKHISILHNPRGITFE